MEGADLDAVRGLIGPVRNLAATLQRLQAANPPVNPAELHAAEQQLATAVAELLAGFGAQVPGSQVAGLVQGGGPFGVLDAVAVVKAVVPLEEERRFIQLMACPAPRPALRTSPRLWARRALKVAAFGLLSELMRLAGLPPCTLATQFALCAAWVMCWLQLVLWLTGVSTDTHKSIAWSVGYVGVAVVLLLKDDVPRRRELARQLTDMQREAQQLSLTSGWEGGLPGLYSVVVAFANSCAMTALEVRIVDLQVQLRYNALMRYVRGRF